MPVRRIRIVKSTKVAKNFAFKILPRATRDGFGSFAEEEEKRRELTRQKYAVWFDDEVEAVRAGYRQETLKAWHENAELQDKLQKAQDAGEELQKLFDQQRKREQPYIEIWRKEDRKRALQIPDYGTFIAWLCDRLERLTEEVVRLKGGGKKK